jgi:hypothetical protein
VGATVGGGPGAFGRSRDNAMRSRSRPPKGGRGHGTNEQLGGISREIVQLRGI